MKVIQNYLRMLADGHIKVFGRELSKEETDLCIALLQAVAAEIEFSQIQTKETT